MHRMKYILVLLFLYAGVALFLNQIRHDKEQQYLDHTATLLQTTYQASLERYALAMDTFYTSVLRRPEILPLFLEGVYSTGKQQAQLREELYQRLLPQFQDLQVRGIRQWQFHQADGHSYLRFHSPDTFGDNLLPNRPSLQLLQTQPIPRYGFEVGRLFIGFRFIHPLFQNGELVGSMETAVSFSELAQALGALATDQTFLFLLHRETVESTIYPGTDYRFEPSEISEAYLLEQDTLTQPGTSNLPLQILLQQLAQLELQTRMQQGETFSLALYYNSLGYSASFIPVFNFNHQPEGYILALHSAPILTSIQWDFYSAISISLTVICLLGWLLLTLHQQRQAVLSQKQRLDAIGQAVGEGIYVLDTEGNTVYVNQAVTRLTGYNADKLYRENLHLLLHTHADQHQPNLKQCPIFNRALKGASYDGDEQFRTRTGELIPVVVTSRPLRENDLITGVVTVFRDITERKEHELKLQQLATTDPLTGLSNRRAFLERLSEELRLCRRLHHESSLLMVDFDFFKTINDQYGHNAGDKVLQHFARQARSCLRQTDLPGRLGGEEFAILLPGTGLEGAYHLAELMRQQLEATPTEFQGQQIPMTLSIGLTLLSPDDPGTSELLNRADKALYRAKAGGRNRVEIG